MGKRKRPRDFLDEHVGPLYDAGGLQSSFGYTQEYLHERIRAQDVLHIVTREGVTLYPSFQFGAGGVLLSHLAAMLKAIDPLSKDGWGSELWLSAPEDDLAGMTPAEALPSDRAADALTFGGQAGAMWLP